MHLMNSKRWCNLFPLKGSHVNTVFQVENFISLQRDNRPNNVAITLSFTESQCDVDSANSRAWDTRAKESSLLSCLTLLKVERQQYPNLAGKRSR